MKHENLQTYAKRVWWQVIIVAGAELPEQRQLGGNRRRENKCAG